LFHRAPRFLFAFIVLRYWCSTLCVKNKKN